MGIDEVIKSSDVVVFSSNTCPYCKKAIEALKHAKIEHKVVVATDAQLEELQKRTGQNSVPSVWVKGCFIGGCNDGPEKWMGVKPGIKSGLLTKLLTTNGDLQLAMKGSVVSLAQAGSTVFRPLRLRGLELKNRIIKAATHDGGTLLEMRSIYTRLCRNDVAMVTVAYVAVSKINKTFDNQHHIGTDNVHEWKALCDSVHKVGGRISAQLHHPGLFCMSSEGKPVGPSLFWLPSKLAWPHTLSIEEILSVKNEYRQAALRCKEAGFDCIELHCGHGYLLSQFLTPIINRRGDKYGGSVQKRAQFPIECVEVIREVVGQEFPIIVKMNADDGFWGGMRIEQALQTASLFAANGVDGIIPSYGFTALNGFGMLRGNVPLKKMVEALPAGSKTIASYLGPYVVPQIEYEPLFLRDFAKQFVQALAPSPACCVIYVGGADSLRGIDTVLRDGCAAVQLGRPLLREPFFVRRMKLAASFKGDSSLATNLIDENGDVESKCIRCNYCTLASIDPVKFKAGCHLLEPGEGQDIEDLARL